eukprot:7042207-Prymnesium_polylepis.2
MPGLFGRWLLPPFEFDPLLHVQMVLFLAQGCIGSGFPRLQLHAEIVHAHGIAGSCLKGKHHDTAGSRAGSIGETEPDIYNEAAWQQAQRARVECMNGRTLTAARSSAASKIATR